MSAVTIQDIANKVGMNRVTVSKILSGKYDGSPDTIEKVQKAADELGYVKKDTATKKSAEAPVKDSELPEGVVLYEPERKETRDHKWTIEFDVKWACEWEYEKDEKGNPKPETKKTVDWEHRKHIQCLVERPTLKQVKRIMADAQREADQADE